MKLKNELGMIVCKFKTIPHIDDYAKRLYATGEYANFETRLAYDCFYASFKSEERIAFYDRLRMTYPDYNDGHISTLLKTAISITYPAIKNFK